VADSARELLARDIDVIEGAYEFFLAYAAQGLSREVQGARVEAQFRDHLAATLNAVSGLADLLGRLIEEEQPTSRAQLEAFRTVVHADAQRASATLSLVQAQPIATSQLVDNLNASVHVRTLLTDLFVLDEVLDLGVQALASEVGESIP
jgi:ABC-type transporter Mla subunit MlaD